MEVKEIKSVAKAISELRGRGFDIMHIVYDYRVENKKTGVVVRHLRYEQLLDMANNKIKFEDFIGKNGY